MTQLSKQSGQNETRLKPCPFCRRKNPIPRETKATGSDRYIVYTISCEKCGCYGPRTISSAENAEKLWNKRAGNLLKNSCKKLSKTASKLPKRKHTGQKEDWHYCHPCQIKRGGKVPKGGHTGITVTSGKCSMCGNGAMLIPNADYIWKGKPYLWD